MKICTKCKIEKELTEFNGSTKAKDGLVNNCKLCLKEKDALRYLLHKESILLRNHLWAKAHPEVTKKNSRSHYLRNKTKIRENHKRWVLAHPGVMKFYNDRLYLQNRETILIKTRLRIKNSRGQYNAYRAKYRALKLQQTPSWFYKEKNLVEALYSECIRLTKTTGTKYHVDHIVPLNNPIVSGFHCLSNLRIILAIDNLSKGNRQWPDMP
jgi:hypothetical protein